MMNIKREAFSVMAKILSQRSESRVKASNIEDYDNETKHVLNQMIKLIKGDDR